MPQEAREPSKKPLGPDLSAAGAGPTRRLDPPETSLADFPQGTILAGQDSSYHYERIYDPEANAPGAKEKFDQCMRPRSLTMSDGSVVLLPAWEVVEKAGHTPGRLRPDAPTSTDTWLRDGRLIYIRMLLSEHAKLVAWNDDKASATKRALAQEEAHDLGPVGQRSKRPLTTYSDSVDISS